MTHKEQFFATIHHQPVDRIKMGILWSAHFQDACAAFGMEKALMVMFANPEMFHAVIDRITDFYLKANEIFYESTKGMLDADLLQLHSWDAYERVEKC